MGTQFSTRRHATPSPAAEPSRFRRHHPSETNSAEPTIEQQLEATSRAVVAADEAYVQEAIGSVHWERRGLLQRLTRADRAVARVSTARVVHGAAVSESLRP